MRIMVTPSPAQLTYLQSEALTSSPMTQDRTGVITVIEIGSEITRYVIAGNGTAVIDWLDRPVWIKDTAEDAER